MEKIAQTSHVRFIYGFSQEKCEALSFFDLPSNNYNNFFWALEGVRCGGSCMTSDNKLEILHKDEHFMLTHVEWDPSSRIGGFKYSMEAGFAIWTFQARIMFFGFVAGGAVGQGVVGGRKKLDSVERRHSWQDVA
eukprot:symbB.v1.2.038576.t1/scaffold5778.1/size23709/2